MSKGSAIPPFKREPMPPDTHMPVSAARNIRFWLEAIDRSGRPAVSARPRRAAVSGRPWRRWMVEAVPRGRRRYGSC